MDILANLSGSFLTEGADERVKNVEFENEMLVVHLFDGRIISVPLAWYPRLFNANKEQLLNWEICGGGYGIHWEELDEDLSTEGLLRRAPTPERLIKSA